MPNAVSDRMYQPQMTKKRNSAFGRGMQNTQRKPPPVSFVCHKFRMNWSGTEPGPSQWGVSNYLSYGVALDGQFVNFSFVDLLFMLVTILNEKIGKWWLWLLDYNHPAVHSGTHWTPGVKVSKNNLSLFSLYSTHGQVWAIVLLSLCWKIVIS
jgi:hypothetical protein